MKRLAVLIITASFFMGGLVFAYTPPEKLSEQYINDYSGVLSDATKQALEAELKTFQEKTSNVIAVALIPTLEDRSLEEYSIDLARNTGIGDKEKDNGVLLLIVTDDHLMRIEVGSRLEGELTDVASRHILDSIIRPEFRANNYDQGVSLGVAAIESALQGEDISSLGQQGDASATSGGFWGFVKDNLFGVIFFIYILLAWLQTLLAPSKSWWLGGVIGLIIGGVIGAIVTSWIVIPLLAVAGLLFDLIVSKTYRPGKRGGEGGTFFGGGWSSGGSSSSSGGSFSGFGGGGFSGGGSSSSW